MNVLVSKYYSSSASLNPLCRRKIELFQKRNLFWEKYNWIKKNPKKSFFFGFVISNAMSSACIESSLLSLDEDRCSIVGDVISVLILMPFSDRKRKTCLSCSKRKELTTCLALPGKEGNPFHFLRLIFSRNYSSVFKLFIRGFEIKYNKYQISFPTSLWNGARFLLSLSRYRNT